MADRSTSYRLIEALLRERGVDFATYIAEQRTARRSWRAIAADIRNTTGVNVGHEIVRRWFADKLTVVIRDAA
jgi:siderophore synthetase component